MCHDDRWEYKVPVQQNQGADAKSDMSDSRQDLDIGSDAPKTTVIMEDGQNARKGEVRD